VAAAMLSLEELLEPLVGSERGSMFPNRLSLAQVFVELGHLLVEVAREVGQLFVEVLVVLRHLSLSSLMMSSPAVSHVHVAAVHRHLETAVGFNTLASVRVSLLRGQARPHCLAVSTGDANHSY